MTAKWRDRPITNNINLACKQLVAFAQPSASIIHAVVADCAADEQLARRIMHKYYARALMGNALPNLGLLVRDKPQSSGRLLQWALPQDQFFHTLMTNMR